jgi:hypothetical protein
MPMKVEIRRLEKWEIFRSISWDARSGLWDSRAYRSRVESNFDSLSGPERAIQLASIEEGAFFKSTVVSISFAVDSRHPARSVNVQLTLADRSSSRRMELVYLGVERLTASELSDMLVDAEILGFEFLRVGNLIRHAFLFIEEEHAVVEASSVSYSITPIGEWENEVNS